MTPQSPDMLQPEPEMVINQPEELPQQKFPLDRDRIRSAFEQMIRWDNEFNEAGTADDRFKAGQMSVGGVGILSALGLHDTFIATQRTIDLHGHIDEALPTDASYEFTGIPNELAQASTQLASNNADF